MCLSGCFSLWTWRSFWNKIPTFSQLEEGIASGRTPVILSARDDKHFSTFVSWLCSFGLYTCQDTSPLCSVTVGAVTEEQGSYKEVGCARWEWDTPPLRSPGSLSSSAFTVWRALHKQSCVLEKTKWKKRSRCAAVERDTRLENPRHQAAHTVLQAAWQKTHWLLCVQAWVSRHQGQMF